MCVKHVQLSPVTLKLLDLTYSKADTDQ